MQQYPVGGPRQPVYDLMRRLGFSMSKHSDKEWFRDGIEVHIYGAGSRALVKAKGSDFECRLDNLAERVAELLREKANG